MCRSVVTVDTIHFSFLELFDLLCRKLRIFDAVIRDLPVTILQPDPGNILTFLIGRDVRDLIRHVHMPMNAPDLTRSRAPATRFQQHSSLIERVFFVVPVMVKDLELFTVEFLRPMALFARLAGGPQVVHRRWNRT